MKSLTAETLPTVRRVQRKSVSHYHEQRWISAPSVIIIRSLSVALAVTLVSSVSLGQSLDSLVAHAIRFSESQLQKSVNSFGDSVKYPRSTLNDGTWKTVKPGDWTSGFFPGSLWRIYELTGEERFREYATTWTWGLKDQQLNTRTHDVGFIMYCSFGNGQRLHPRDEYKNILLQSARSLATRFNSHVGCIRSWDNPQWQFPVIIDNMMNLELLFWASKNGGGKDLYTIAVSHAEKTMQNHFRPDGSTHHVVSYDSATGKILVKETHQGFSHESVWARGQAWAIYGFTMAYRETGDTRFLQTAERAADWFIKHLPDDAVPYWDFNAPQIPREPRDASAAAIAASALFELSTQTKSNALRAQYSESAKRIITALCSKPYLAAGSTSSGLLNHATGNWPANSEIDVSLIYGDYYFLEAMMRYRQPRTGHIH